jgi:uncharacterized membrane protein
MNVSWSALLVICGILLAIVLVLLWHPQRSRTKTSTFTNRPRTPAVFRDDERYWYGGLFYNNPDDPAMFVPKRYGLGWTVNFGHSQGRLVLFGILLLPLVMLILTILISGTAPVGCHLSGCHPFP